MDPLIRARLRWLLTGLAIGMIFFFGMLWARSRAESPSLLATAAALGPEGASASAAASAAPSSGAPEPASAAASAVPSSGAPEPASAEALPGPGFAVWESNRSGAWRLWTKRFDETEPRQLTPEEGRRAHCCPHISPDGRSLVYLSLDPGPEKYTDIQHGELRLRSLDSGEEQVLAASARTYGEHRAAIWHDDDALVYLDGEGHSVRLRLSDGAAERLTAEPHPERGWLISPDLRYATFGVPTFSDFDAQSREVVEMQAFGGCQPYFSPDGRWGYWTSGAGGPIDRIDLESREIYEILGKNDPRLPADRGYLYFPMLSADQRLLAWAASDGDHPHFSADYDVFVAEVHPEHLELVGPPVRLTFHPGVDRFPDVYLEEAQRPVPEIEPPAPPALTESGWPAVRDGLVFLWRSGDAVNRVTDARRGVDRSFPIEREGRALFDHAFRMDLGGDGAFVASDEAAGNVLYGLRERNALTIEASVSSAGGDGSLIAFSAGARLVGKKDRRNLVLAQKNGRLVLTLLTAGWGPVENRVDLGPMPREEEHLAVTYRPGRLRVYRDGALKLDSSTDSEVDVQGDFFHWKARPLRFGNEWRNDSFWSGKLANLAIWNRELGAQEITGNAARVAEDREMRVPVPSVRVRLRLVERPSRLPTLDEITPYREALAVYRYEVTEVLSTNSLSGLTEGTIIPVAHWAILSGENVAISSNVLETTLEPLLYQPQLEAVHLSDEFGRGDTVFYSISK